MSTWLCRATSAALGALNERKDMNREFYTFRHQFDEKTGVILGCPGGVLIWHGIQCTERKGKKMG